MTDTHSIGRHGEQVAVDYLRARGYVILERNYRFEREEVDVVAVDRSGEDRPVLVFVEVKSRTGSGYGRPEEAVTGTKQQKLIRVARAYLHERKMASSPCRFDVLSVRFRSQRPTEEDEPDLEHFEDAFRPG